jgi:hypothetical protein
VSAPGAWEAVKIAIVPTAEMSAIKGPGFAFLFFEQKGAEDLCDFMSGGFRV